MSLQNKCPTILLLFSRTYLGVNANSKCIFLFIIQALGIQDKLHYQIFTLTHLFTHLFKDLLRISWYWPWYNNEQKKHGSWSHIYGCNKYSSNSPRHISYFTDSKVYIFHILSELILKLMLCSQFNWQHFSFLVVHKIIVSSTINGILELMQYGYM